MVYKNLTTNYFRKRLFWFPVILFLVFSASCSSRPGSPQETNSKQVKASDFMTQGNRQYDEGLFQNALDSFNQALGIYSGLGNIKGTVRALNAQIKVYTSAKQYNRAEALIEYTVNFAAMSGDQTLLRSALNQKADYFLKRELINKALEVTDPSLTPDLNENTDIAATMWRLRGSANKKIENMADAEEQLLKALSIDLKIGNYSKAAADYYLLASVYSLQNRYEEAIEMAEEALDKDRYIESLMGVASDLNALGKIHEKAGNTEQALFYYHQAYLAWIGLGREDAAEKAAESILELDKDAVLLNF